MDSNNQGLIQKDRRGRKGGGRGDPGMSPLFPLSHEIWINWHYYTTGIKMDNSIEMMLVIEVPELAEYYLVWLIVSEC